MFTINRTASLTVLALLMLSLVTGNAFAQRQGGGTNPAGTPLVFNYIAIVNGTTPVWSGDFTMGAPTMLYGNRTTNLSFSIRGKKLNLPDNTRLYINLYTSDVATGTQSSTDASRWHCMSAMQVVSQLGIVKGYNDFYDAPTSTIVRKLDKVVITDASGTILATAHP